VWPVVLSPHWFKFRQRTVHSIFQNNNKDNKQEQQQQLMKYPLDHVQRVAPLLLYGHSTLILPTPMNRPRKVIDTGVWCENNNPVISSSCSLTNEKKEEEEVCNAPKLPSIVTEFLTSSTQRSNQSSEEEDSKEEEKVIYITLGAAWMSLNIISAYHLGCCLSRSLHASFNNKNDASESINSSYRVIMHFIEMLANNQNLEMHTSKFNSQPLQPSGGNDDDNERTVSNVTFSMSSISIIELAFLSGYFEIDFFALSTPSKIPISVKVIELTEELKSIIMNKRSKMGGGGVLVWRGGLDHSQLLKHCSLVMHHGGSVTCCQYLHL
jgi:hypothetical protein